MTRSRLSLYAAIAVTGLVYLPTLGTFLVADSWVFMMPESFMDTFGYFFRSMLPDDTNALWLRPIPMFTFWLDRFLWPGTMWGPHLQNLLFHSINIVLVWCIVGSALRFAPDKKNMPDTSLASLTACLVYGLHPLAVGAVAWVAARFDVMCVTFGLGALYLWLKASETPRPARIIILSVSLLILSVLSKEQGVVFVAACAVFSLTGYFTIKETRKQAIRSLIWPVVLMAVYILYRLTVFKGLGGYLEARNGLSALPPVFYGIAILFPYMNIMPNTSITITLTLAVLALIAMSVWMIRAGTSQKPSGVKMPLIAAVSAVVFIGLATNAPNPGMTFERILGHAESRFALIPIAGIAILAGCAAGYAAPKRRKSLVIILIALWSITAAWRTDAQIQSWRHAGTVAQTIVEDTIALAPNPPQRCRLLFFDIPRTNAQWAYIYGIGLKEALLLRYGRWDIDIVRFPTREDLKTARPDYDFVFSFNTATGHLERLTARKKNDTIH